METVWSTGIPRDAERDARVDLLKAQTLAANAPTLYRAQVGRRPSFLSAGDRDAYVKGYLTRRASATGTPEWRGMLDALEADEASRAEELAPDAAWLGR